VRGGGAEVSQGADEAKAKLGPRFDLKTGHDAVLLSGAMLLTVRRRHVSEWIATQV
jgi:uncharacterized protein (DUF885 family)